MLQRDLKALHKEIELKEQMIDSYKNNIINELGKVKDIDEIVKLKKEEIGYLIGSLSYLSKVFIDKDEMGEVRKNMVLYDFTDKIYDFILEKKLPDIRQSLIMDYIEVLYRKGVDLSKKDVEIEVYNFYSYYTKLNNLLDEYGEDEFIEVITNEELSKI